MSKLISLILMILLLPIMLIISAIVLLDDGYPIFYKQKRVGFKNRHFFIFKFRTMKLGTPEVATHLINKNSIPFIRSGKFLRAYSLDELPQLYNIIRGDLSLIGPRPALHNQYDLIDMRTKKGIHNIMPGVTGWAQVNGRDDLSLRKKVDLELWYLNNNSFFVDIKIIWLTIIKVLRAENVRI